MCWFSFSSPLRACIGQPVFESHPGLSRGRSFLASCSSAGCVLVVGAGFAVSRRGWGSGILLVASSVDHLRAERYSEGRHGVGTKRRLQECE